MYELREIQRIENDHIEIQIPEDFPTEIAGVIVKPYNQKSVKKAKIIYFQTWYL